MNLVSRKVIAETLDDKELQRIALSNHTNVAGSRSNASKPTIMMNGDHESAEQFGGVWDGRGLRARKKSENPLDFGC